MSEDLNARIGRPLESRESPYSPLVSYLRENGLPNLERLNLRILLGAHGSKDDADKVFSHMGDTDVFIPELANWRPETERMYNEISKGLRTHTDYSVEEYRFNDYRNALLGHLAGSGKYVAFADVQKNDPEVSLPTDDGRKIDAFPKEIISRQWSRTAARNLLSARIGRVIEAAKMRDLYIAAHIGPAIIRALTDDPSRGERTTLNVTMSIGAAHEPVVSHVRNIHPEVESRMLYTSDDEPSYTGDVIEALYENKEVSDELVDGALMESLLIGAIRLYLLDEFKNYIDDEAFIYGIAADMNEEEREAFHELFRKGNASDTAKYVRTLIEKQKAKTTGEGE